MEEEVQQGGDMPDFIPIVGGLCVVKLDGEPHFARGKVLTLKEENAEVKDNYHMYTILLLLFV